jgi:very-short-patch-repair endonuclease
LRKLEPDRVRFARHLRATATDAERLLWPRLRGGQLGIKFRRQVPIGPYVADFVCLEHRLIVEVDGAQHLESEHDLARDRWFSTQGFRTLRFWNSEVMGNIEGVLQMILDARAAPPPRPSPVKGEGARP